MLADCVVHRQRQMGVSPLSGSPGDGRRGTILVARLQEAMSRSQLPYINKMLSGVFGQRVSKTPLRPQFMGKRFQTDIHGKAETVG